MWEHFCSLLFSENNTKKKELVCLLICEWLLLFGKLDKTASQ